MVYTSVLSVMFYYTINKNKIHFTFFIRIQLCKVAVFSSQIYTNSNTLNKYGYYSKVYDKSRNCTNVFLESISSLSQVTKTNNGQSLAIYP